MGSQSERSPASDRTALLSAYDVPFNDNLEKQRIDLLDHSHHIFTRFYVDAPAISESVDTALHRSVTDTAA
jgi:Mor family transcriptional regulator